MKTKGETTSNRKEILAIVEELHREIYKSQTKIHTPEETEKVKGVVNQGSDDLPEITKDKIKVFYQDEKGGSS